MLETYTYINYSCSDNDIAKKDRIIIFSKQPAEKV